MDQPAFNPSASVKFDLDRGVVSLDGQDTRVLVPSALLVQLCKSAGASARRDFGKQLGRDTAGRVARRLGDALLGASLESLLDHLGGDLALLGLGSLGLERWGRALVFTITGSPLGAEGEDLLSSVLEGAMDRLYGRETELVSLGREGERLRLVALSPIVAERVRQWLASELKWGEIVTRLQQGEEKKPA